MFFDDHAPPHLHAECNAFKAVVRLDTLEVVEGRLPPRAPTLVLDRAAQHRAELMADWELRRAKQPPRPIAPLE